MNSNISSPWDDEYNGSQIGPIYEPLWTMLQVFLHNLSIKTVLDFGCGDGKYSFLIGESGLNVIGIDNSVRAIEKATSYKQDHKDDRCRFLCNNHIPINLPNESIDAVIMLNSYHCLTNKERSNILNQVNRVLKKNGCLFVSVLAIDDESYPRNEWKEIDVNTFDNGKGKIFHFFSPNELSMELKGFEILDNRMLQNIHPETGRKSALYVITARSKK
ncbi:MAG: class I SAM-dependent methyltransferase [Bacteroidetes bacterium]|nr:class I SAM-dependent methyltransferase [Bacteroidota bacterium]